MATQSQDHIASVFLRTLGAPDTAPMRAAVRAWMRAEGISSVKRNNPWNLHSGAACHSPSGFCPRHDLPGQVGVVNVGPGDQNVAVFDTLDHGVQASANNLIRLSSSGYGYDRVIRYARAGDPVGFLNALALSSWSAGRYGTKGGGGNKLVKIYNDITRGHADVYSYKAMQGKAKQGTPVGAPVTTGTTYTADQWNAFIATLTPGTRYISASNADEIRTKAKAAGIDLSGVDLTQFYGKSMSDLRDYLASQGTIPGADLTAGLPNVADPLAAVATFLGKLSDPGTWARLLALMVGLALTAYGAVNVYRATAEA